MGVGIVRFKENHQYFWGAVNGQDVYPIECSFHTLADFITHDGIQLACHALEQNTDKLPMAELELVSPVTRPSQIICQGANYSAHRIEAGMQASRPPYNLIFTKAPSSLSGPYDPIECPSHVKLLDYEIELGLIIRKEINQNVEVTTENLHAFIAGYVITNDISARDIQLIEGQWFKGKSYRTFCPTGPIVYLFEEHEPVTVHNLDLVLSINGEVRQSANTEQLLYKPEETLTELSEIINFYPGDLLLTGTPGGVALNLTAQELALLSNPTVSYDTKMQTLIEKSQAQHHYLQHGDVIKCEIKSKDGHIDLGVQENQVIFMNESMK